MDAFAELFEPLRGSVYAAACRLTGPTDAEDVVMDTFLKAWKALPGFDGRSSLKTWLLRISSNRARDVLRARGTVARRQTVGVDVEEAILHAHDPAADTPAELVAHRDAQGFAHEALRELPEAHQAILLLRYVDDLSYTEIAAATGVSIGTVMSRLFNAKRKLRAAWSRLTGEVLAEAKEPSS